MKLRLMSTLFVLIGFFLGTPSLALAQSTDPAVKKSDSGICHDKSSPSYKQTTNFTAFKTMDECVKSGGRPPKGSK